MLLSLIQSGTPLTRARRRTDIEFMYIQRVEKIVQTSDVLTKSVFTNATKNCISGEELYQWRWKIVDDLNWFKFGEKRRSTRFCSKAWRLHIFWQLRVRFITRCKKSRARIFLFSKIVKTQVSLATVKQNFFHNWIHLDLEDWNFLLARNSAIFSFLSFYWTWNRV